MKPGGAFTQDSDDRDMQRSHNTQTLLVLLVGVLFSIPALAERELLLFPELLLEHEQDESLDNADLTPSLDLFGTARQGRLRLLGEVFISDEEFDVERLKLGYEFSPGTVAWAGRVHNPLGYWITQYHHGSYLQTSISRPEVARFEDEGGLFPNHITGLLLDTTHTTGNRAFDFSLLAGAGPELRSGNNSELQSFDLLDASSSKHKLNITGRFAYRPDSASGNQVGLFASYVKIPVTKSVYDTLELTTAGVFSSWQLADLTLTGALYLVRDELSNGGETDDGNFASGYLQADYLALEVWTPYTRLEQSFGDDNDSYIELMTKFIPKRQLLGMRWDFTPRQALKLEYSRNHARSKTYGKTFLNWSAVFP